MSKANSWTRRERLRYAIDGTFSKGTASLVAWLGLITFLTILLCGTILWIVAVAPSGAGPESESGDKPGVIDLIWVSAMRMLDPGTLGGDTGRWSYLLGMLFVTLFGVFITSTLIGVLASGIESKLESLRKGHSKVLESNHTLILGWSPNIFTMLAELTRANQNRKSATIVILAARDKVEMEDEIRLRLPDTKTTKIVCRSGNPLDLDDLAVVNPQGSRSIIVLEADESASDAHVVKALLALINSPDRRPESYHIVAELRDAWSLDAARLVGGDEAVILVTTDLIARLIVQTSRQSGLAIVLTELLDFGGDEIYFKHERQLDGARFGDVLLAYETSTVIGLRNPYGVLVNPPMDHILGPQDEIIAISEDDDTVVLAPGFSVSADKDDPRIDRSVLLPAPTLTKEIDRTLILGWNSWAGAVAKVFDEFAAPGSILHIVAMPAAAENSDLDDVVGKLVNQQVTVARADTTDRRTLDKIDLMHFDQVIVLPYSDLVDVQEADAWTLMTLLHVRERKNHLGSPIHIVTEMLDIRNRRLAEAIGSDDHIVSRHLTSLLITQISENRHLHAVFEHLFQAEGSEIYLRPAGDYITPGAEASYATIVEAARQRGETAIGFRDAALATNGRQSYGVMVNPAKSLRRTYAPEDSIIVMAEN